jgi:hypothetical protein
MYLKCRKRRKDGKVHSNWSVQESRRVGGRVVQRHVLYLGELSESQKKGWEKVIEVIDGRSGRPAQMSLFPATGAEPGPATGAPGWERVEVNLSAVRIERPRQWGGCWLADETWRRLGLDEFFAEKLGGSRKGTEWEKVLRSLVAYRLLAPGSEWRLHRHWFGTTALEDILGVDAGVAQKDTLYRCHDLLLGHKDALFAHLRRRWADLFGAGYEVLLYDLTSTYFECDAPDPAADPRRFGYSRDRRGDCVQVVIALVVTPEGLPLAYEMLPGNTADKATLGAMIDTIHRRHGKAGRIWVMDRGIPTEETLEAMRQSDPPVHYLVGTPKSRLKKFEAALAELPWTKVKGELRVKHVERDGETYIYTESPDRTAKERAIRRRALKAHIRRLRQLCAPPARARTRDDTLLLLGKAQQKAGRAAASLIEATVAPDGSLHWRLDKEKLRAAIRREGRYLLRTNLADHQPDALWRHYMQLVHVEEAFRTLKGDLSLRPVHHRLPHRIEAHLFIAFLAYCILTTLRQQLRAHAPGLTPRSLIEKLSSILMLDLHVPATDGRRLLLTRRSEPDSDTRLLLHLLGLRLPPQPPPKVYHAEGGARLV